MLIAADHHLLIRPVNLNHIERRSRRHAQALTLSDGEVVDAAVFADHFPARSYQLTRSVRQSLATLGEVRINKALIVAARDEADLLRVGLLRQRQPPLAGQLANLGLGHAAQRKERAAELLLGEAEEEIGLVLAAVSWALEQPAFADLVILHSGVVARRYAVGANLLCNNE